MLKIIITILSCVTFYSGSIRAEDSNKSGMDVLFTRSGEEISGSFLMGNSDYIVMRLDKGETQIPISTVERVVFSSRPDVKRERDFTLAEPKELQLTIARASKNPRNNIISMSGYLNNKVELNNLTLIPGDKLDFHGSGDGERFEVTLLTNQSKRIRTNNLFVSNINKIGEVNKPFNDSKVGNIEEVSENGKVKYKAGYKISAKLTN
ncbi:hypothetical protein [Microbulbifer epialgicus]|uniref:Uncharacterized protein n=1 Tax=Microbulbifer epialgicus TaxID=393907 RepID=A0ABV4NUV4_9GAMM